MSYEVSLLDSNDPVSVERFIEGGTYPVGGSTVAELSVTYNYASLYREVFGQDGLRWLDGITAFHSEEALELGVLILGTRTHTDYWAPTKGNAGHSLSILLGWAKQNPEAIWSVS